MPLISLTEIQKAQERIAPYLRKTPLIPFDFLAQKTQKEVLLKCENLQRTGSFKIRGAANCILENLAQAKKSGVIAASAGNHAQGVAAICHRLGIKATIVMPKMTPTIKVNNTQRWGAKVELVGNVYDEAYEHAMGLAKTHGYLFIHPFHDPLVMAGQGTCALELCEDPLFNEVEAVVVSVGGGGWISGVGSCLRALRPNIKVYGVAAKNAPATWKSFVENRPANEEVAHTIAEGVSTKRCDDFMLSYLKDAVDKMFVISEEKIAHAISLLAEHGKLVVEGAGALPVAALLEDVIPEKKVALLLSGGNIDLTTLSHVLQRGLVEQGRFVRLLVTIIDRPGGLNAVTEVLAEQGANILQVFHQRASLQSQFGETEIELDLETKGMEHTEEIMQTLKRKGFRVTRAA